MSWSLLPWQVFSAGAETYYFKFQGEHTHRLGICPTCFETGGAYAHSAPRLRTPLLVIYFQNQYIRLYKAIYFPMCNTELYKMYSPVLIGIDALHFIMFLYSYKSLPHWVSKTHLPFWPFCPILGYSLSPLPNDF